MHELLERLARLLSQLLGGDGASVDARRQLVAADDAGGTRCVAAGESRDASSRHAARESAGREPSSPGAAEASERAPFLLSIDDAGQFLVTLEERLVIGHLRSGEADLPFLADVGPRHAILERQDSFRGGPVWRIAPVGAERVTLNGLDLEGSVALAPDDEVRLGENLVLIHRVPDPASHTVVLDLLGGAECAGARHVVLFGDGVGGRLRIGPSLGRHVRVAGLEQEVSLERSGRRLFVRSELGVSGADPCAGGVTLGIPPVRRYDIRVGRVQGSRPPFGIALGPADLARGVPRP